MSAAANAKELLQQAASEAVTVAQANAALAARRSQSSSSRAGTSQAAG